jgi:hypothetical protein
MATMRTKDGSVGRPCGPASSPCVWPARPRRSAPQPATTYRTTKTVTAQKKPMLRPLKSPTRSLAFARPDRLHLATLHFERASSRRFGLALPNSRTRRAAELFGLLSWRRSHRDWIMPPAGGRLGFHRRRTTLVRHPCCPRSARNGRRAARALHRAARCGTVPLLAEFHHRHDNAGRGPCVPDMLSARFTGGMLT